MDKKYMFIIAAILAIVLAALTFGILKRKAIV